MKKIILLLNVFSFLLSMHCFSQWYKLNTGVSSDLYSIYFTNVNTGYAVGGGGTVIKTSDAGKSWQNYSISDYNQDFMSVYFTSNDTGFASSAEGRIYKSTNAGIDWFAVYDGEIQLLLYSIYLTNAKTGYCVGADGTKGYILKTSNYGKLWTVILSSDSLGWLEDAYFIDSVTGYAVGGGGLGSYGCTILKTTNGGGSWIHQINYPKNANNVGLYGVYFINADTGIAVGQDIILKTTNGGSSWNSANCNISDWWEPKPFLSDYNTVYAGGQQGNIIKSTDGGNNFFLQYNVKSEIRGFFFTGKDTGYCVAYNGIFKTTNGGNWVNELTMDNGQLIIYPNPAIEILNIDIENIENYNPVNIQIYNLQGEEIIKQLICNKHEQINISHLNEGVYIAKIANNKTVRVAKFIKVNN